MMLKVLLATLLSFGCAERLSVDPSTSQFVDSVGNQYLFRGEKEICDISRGGAPLCNIS
jgi:hypothetical protein